MNKSRIFLAIALSCVVFSMAASGQQVRDRKKSGDADVLVVPKGTRIQTDISHSSQSTPITPYEFEGRVEIPVRLGFTTAIPASAKITVLVTSTYFESPHQEPVYQEFVEVVNVTIDGRVYDIYTDRLQMQAGTAKEVAFTLIRDLNISR